MCLFAFSIPWVACHLAIRAVCGVPQLSMSCVSLKPTQGMPVLSVFRRLLLIALGCRLLAYAGVALGIGICLVTWFLFCPLGQCSVCVR